MSIRRYTKVLLSFMLVGTGVTILLYGSPTKTIRLTQPNVLSLNIFSSSDGSHDRNPPKAVEKWEDQCSPRNHVMFLKTHKCASSTVQNIFIRYGFRRNLTFALPENGNTIGFPKFFQAEMIPKHLLPDSGKVDIFAVHTRLYIPEVQKVLHRDALWVTVLRDPSLQYESLFQFYKMGETYKMNLSQYTQEPIKKLLSLPRHEGKFGKNQMLFDLGFAEDMRVMELRAAIDRLDQSFHLVMISELMDESLILLRHLLCWSLHDVVYFTKNARREEVKPDLNPELLGVLRELNSADVILYDHFLAKHKKAVLEFGTERMAQEVSALQALQENYYKSCGTREVEVYSGLVNAYISSNRSDLNCMALTLPELPFLGKIRDRQKAVLQEKRPP